MSINTPLNPEDWWPVIEAMAEMIACGLEHEELDEELVKTSLLQQGFSPVRIDRALDWLETASVSGQVAEVFSMLVGSNKGLRIRSPLEAVCISEKMWMQFHDIRARGIISSDFAERILEGMRAIDTRDWEDEDVQVFFREIISATLPHASEQLVERILKNRPCPELYS